MKIYAPICLLNFVFRGLGRFADSEPLHQLRRASHLVQALKVFTQRLLRLASNDLSNRRNQLIVSLLKVHVESARQKNCVAEPELPNLSVMNELGDDFVAVYPARRSL